MLYNLLTMMPPNYVWVALLMIVAVIAHHAARGKKWWAMLTGLTLSFLLGWFAETLGLGWYAEKLFGSKGVAVCVYILLGFFWLAVESLRDLRRMIPRFETYAESWCVKETMGSWSSMDADGREELLSGRLLESLANRNAHNPRDPILYPPHYYRSRERRWWFASWFVFWPAYLLNSVLSAIVVDPWKWLSRLLPAYVRLIQGLVIPQDLYPKRVAEPRRRLDDDLD